jgi:hypothetical protein
MNLVKLEDQMDMLHFGQRDDMRTCELCHHRSDSARCMVLGRGVKIDENTACRAYSNELDENMWVMVMLSLRDGIYYAFREYDGGFICNKKKDLGFSIVSHASASIPGDSLESRVFKSIVELLATNQAPKRIHNFNGDKINNEGLEWRLLGIGIEYTHTVIDINRVFERPDIILVSEYLDRIIEARSNIEGKK